jgi:hypothetical protein
VANSGTPFTNHSGDSYFSFKLRQGPLRHLTEAAISHLIQPFGPKAAIWLTFADAKKFGIDVMPLPHGADAHWYSAHWYGLYPAKKAPAIAPNELDGVGGRARIGEATVPAPGVFVEDAHRAHGPQFEPCGNLSYPACTKDEMLPIGVRDVAPQLQTQRFGKWPGWPDAPDPGRLTTRAP